MEDLKVNAQSSIDRYRKGIPYEYSYIYKLKYNSKTEAELNAMRYEALDMKYAKFHQNNQIGGENSKYVIGDWFSSEIVYYSDGTVNDTPEDVGTFNVYSGNNGFFKNVVHGLFDVVPYMIWGNSPNDSTTIIDRIIMIGK